MLPQRKIRVLQTIRQGLIGGGETHVLSLVGQLDRSRYEPVVLSFTGGPMIEQLRKMGVEHYVIPSLKAFDLGQWKKVKALLAEKNIDMVHAHGSRAASNLFFPARSLKIPMLYTIHGWSFHDDQAFPVKWARVMSERFLTANMQRNIAVSASNFQTGRAHFRNFRATVINNGIDLRKFSTTTVQSNIRQELGIPEENILVGFIARMTAQKDPLTMLRAFAQVLKSRQQITLLMVGEGELAAEARQLAEQLGIAGQVIFQPFRQDVPELLAATDIYCLPSLWEGLPIGLLEAMAMENAVIVTRVDGSKEIIRHQQNGWMIAPGHKDELAAAIITLANNAALRSTLQQAALETVRNGFNVEGMARQVEQVYADIWTAKNKVLA